MIKPLLFLAAAQGLSAAGSLYDFTVRTIDGQQQSLAAYRGKVLLIVNTASR